MPDAMRCLNALIPRYAHTYPCRAPVFYRTFPQANYFLKCMHPMYNSIGCSSTDQASTELSSEQEKLKQLHDYFNQYVEEYYEEVVDEERLEEEAKVVDKKRNELPPSIRDLLSEEDSTDGVFSLPELVDILRAERAADIVCISVPPSEGPYHNIVICSPQNRRHGEALLQTIRKCLKVKCNLEETEMQRTVKNTGGWYCLPMGNTVLHVMTPEARQKYDLEALWGLACEESGDEEDAEDLIPRPI